MTREETQDLLAMISAVYTNFKPLDKTATVEAWKLALEDYNANEVALAFKSYMTSDTSGFAPVPGQIVERIQMIMNPGELNEMEAWSLVRKAISKSGRESVKEYKKLPPEVQKAVGEPIQLQTWALDEHFSEEVASSNFMRCYRNEIRRKQELEKMPKDVRQLIEKSNIDSYSMRLEQSRSELIDKSKEYAESEPPRLIQGIPMPERLKDVYEMKGD